METQVLELLVSLAGEFGHRFERLLRRNDMAAIERHHL
jgi:aspartate aminotransferase-like enzyme